MSIVTPILNGARYLDECVASVLNQSYGNIEHVFADGGSTDGTLEKLEGYRREYPDRIRYFSCPDKGVGSALKRALAESCGDIIGWIDSDDVYEPSAVEIAVGRFGDDKAVNFVYGGCRIIDEVGKPIGCFVIRDYDRKVWLNEWHYIVFCATFFRREVVDRVGFVNDLGNDVFFYMKVARRFRLVRLEETLTNWRLHGDSISLKASDREASIRRNRAKEDFLLVLKHGGSVFSPKALSYFTVIQPSLSKRLKPVLGWTFPFFGRWNHQIRLSSAIVRKEMGSYAWPLFKGFVRETRDAVLQVLDGIVRRFGRRDP
ncbi:MAG: glycosyltransferase [Bauldia litoralis]